MYQKMFRINRHAFDGRSDDVAGFVLAIFVFGTMYISLIQL
jgi:hypothetical protein